MITSFILAPKCLGSRTTFFSRRTWKNIIILVFFFFFFFFFFERRIDCGSPRTKFSLLRGWDKEVRRSSTKTLSSLSSPRDLPRRRRRLTPPLPLRRGATLFRAGGALRRENSAAEK
jgi:hypothetical protein